MDLFYFIIIVLGLFYIIYSFFETPDNNPVKDRLKSYAGKPSEEKKENEPSVSKNVQDYMYEKTFSYFSSKKDKNNKEKFESLKKLLIESGQASTDDNVYKLLSSKIIFGLIGLFTGLTLFFFGGFDIFLSLAALTVCPITLYRFPDMRLKSFIKKKNEEIEYNLPDALDLLTVCVEAGLGLDATLQRVAKEQSRTAPLLAKELKRVGKDMSSGLSRQEAFRNLGNRNDLQDIKTFVSLLIQSDKLGTSIGQSLRTYSDTVRIRRRQKAEALAAKASVKMVIPLVLFILPSMFVVILAPAAISLMKNFNQIPN